MVTNNSKLTHPQQIPKQCEDDLKKYIIYFQEQHFYMILSMDENYDPNKITRNISVFLNTTQLIEFTKILNQLKNNITTHLRGSTIIDLVMVSPNFQKYIQQIHILPIDTLESSYHKGIFI